MLVLSHEEVAMEGDSADTMRAAILDRYGPPEVVRIAKVPRRPARGGELLVRVLAAPVTFGDARIRGVHDSSFDLDDIVEAHRRVETGHKRGNVIVRPCKDPAEEGP
jgi:NADPH:quinone reductase-like Zn-dependent oxidoreductase